MNFVACWCFVARSLKTRILSDFLSIILLSTCLVGCGDQVRLPSGQQLAEFENAGPAGPTVDLDSLVKAKIGGGPYRVVPGEVLELTMPAILQIVTASEPAYPERTAPIAPYVCRVSETGTITLPVVGEIEVAGKTLAEIESAVINAYYPKYAVTRPSVFARVLEYITAKVSITGAIKKPGVYELKSDQMSLVTLLMEAGGIIDEGAAVIRITHSDQSPERTQSTSEGTIPDLVEKPNHHKKDFVTKPLLDTPIAKNTTGQEYLPQRRISSDGFEVELSFEQQNSSGTKGQLIVKFDKKVQHFKNCDLTNALHRQVVVKLLTEKDARFSTVNLEKKFLALVQELKAGSGVAGIADGAEKTNEELKQKPDRNNAERNLASDDVFGKRLVNGVDSEKSLEPRGNPQSHTNSKPVILPVKGLNIPFADVALEDGDSVVVERLTMPMFTVIGLVNKPGNYPYPPDVRYNLMQALAFAGGLDEEAEPRYASIYRLSSDGGITSATLQFTKGSKLTNVVDMSIKPGDIIDVAHTPRTRTNLFLQRIFHFSIGAYIPIPVSRGN